MQRRAPWIVIVALVAPVGCTVNAPPPQDLQGTGFDVVDGKVTVDTSTVPVVAECAEGQTIVRTATGWSCISPPDASKIPVVDSCADGEAVVRVGDGWGCAPVDGNGVVTVADACDPGEAVVATTDGWGCAAVGSGGGNGVVSVTGECLPGEPVVATEDGWGCGPVDDTEVVVVTGACSDGQAVVASSSGWECVSVNDVVKVSGGCAEGQLLVKGATGFQCQAPPPLYSYGEGLESVPGDSSKIRVKFGAGQNEVARGSSLTNLQGQIDNLKVNKSISSCAADTAGALLYDTETKTLRLCVDSTFRAVELVETETFPLAYQTLAPPGPPSPETSGQWPSTSGGAAFFLGSDVGRVNLGGFHGFGRIGTNESPPPAAGGGAIGQRRLRLPESNFSIEVFFSGSEAIFSHGEGLELRLQQSELIVREFGRETRYPIPPLDTQPNQVVYVHTATNARLVYFNGREVLRGTDATFWSGPYLGDEAVFTLGNRFGGVNGGTYHRITFSGIALTSGDIRSRCRDFFSTIPNRCPL
jgi:hypothetical protein